LKEIENFTKAFEAEEIKNKIKFEQQLTAGKKIAMFCVKHIFYKTIIIILI
jgi:hypothetical protein